jgi:hypothetical protein
MSDKNDKYRAQLREVTQPHCDGEIQAVGIFQQKGMLGAGLVSECLSPLAGKFMKRGNQDGGPKPKGLMLLAVTPAKIHLFESSQRMGKHKVKRPISEWERGAVAATREHAAATDQLVIALPSEEGTIRLESMKLMSGGFNEPVFEALGA